MCERLCVWTITLIDPTHNLPWPPRQHELHQWAVSSVCVCVREAGESRGAGVSIITADGDSIWGTCTQGKLSEGKWINSRERRGAKKTEEWRSSSCNQLLALLYKTAEPFAPLRLTQVKAMIPFYTLHLVNPVDTWRRVGDNERKTDIQMPSGVMLGSYLVLWQHRDANVRARCETDSCCRFNNVPLSVCGGANKSEHSGGWG